ncbi:MAG: metalloprotease PmbA [Gammaproteobacteria bacterium]
MSIVSPQDAARLQSLVEAILARAEKAGASQAAAAASIDTGLSVTARLRDVETLEQQRDHALGVTVYFGRHKGSAASTDFSEAAVNDTVDKACSIAKETSEDAFAGLADVERMADDIPDLDLEHPWALDTDEAIRAALEGEAAALDYSKNIDNTEGATLTTHGGVRVYGNTHGFLGIERSTSHSLSCAPVARNGTGMQRDYYYTLARDPADLEQPATVGEQAARRTLERLGAHPIRTCQVPVVFPAELARGFIGHFVAAIRGAAQYRGASFLLNAAGERVFPEYVQISEQPHLLKAMASAAFDNEGVATRERKLIDHGVLTGYVLSSYSARKLGLETTGNAGGIHNLVVEPNSGDLKELLRQMGRGFLVRELMGYGVNTVNGDYSRGAAGFWVEDGEIKHPVEEVTIAGNLRDLYRNVVAIGNDTDTRGSIRTGSILVERMTIAGQ